MIVLNEICVAYTRWGCTVDDTKENKAPVGKGD